MFVKCCRCEQVPVRNEMQYMHGDVYPLSDDSGSGNPLDRAIVGPTADLAVLAATAAAAIVLLSLRI